MLGISHPISVSDSERAAAPSRRIGTIASWLSAEPRAASANFSLGFAMTCVGGYLLTNQVMVAGSYWNFYGNSTFGITLIPMVMGVGLLFWNGRSLAGWFSPSLAPFSSWPA